MAVDRWVAVRRVHELSVFDVPDPPLIAHAAEVGPEPLRTRGPVTYAGPGSLGGTESALRR